MVAEHGTMRFPVATVFHHAGTVDRVSDAMELARSAVRDATMNADAYGHLCQFLPVVLNPITDLAATALRGTVESLQSSATALRTAAGNAEAADSESSRRVASASRSTRPLPELPL